MLYTAEIEKNSSNTKTRGSQAHWNLQTIKSNVPLTMAALATVVVKNSGKLA